MLGLGWLKQKTIPEKGDLIELELVESKDIILFVPNQINQLVDLAKQNENLTYNMTAYFYSKFLTKQTTNEKS